MYFPSAGIDIPVWIPPVAAFCVSALTSMGGVSGAFLLLPFQMSVLGYTAPSVSATNQVFNIVATPGGVWRYLREGRMVWPLALAIILGTLPGVVLGAYIRVSLLPDPRRFKFFAGLVLLYIAYRLVLDLHRRRKAGKGSAGSGRHRGKDLPPVRVESANLRRVRYEFDGEVHDFQTLGIFILSLVVGIIGGTYGIGGGSIIAPFLVSFFRLPVHTVAGAALLGTFATSVIGVAVYQIIAPLHPGMSVAPDWLLGALFGVGGLAGMYLGARSQKYVPAGAIKIMLAAILCLTALRYLLEFFG